MNPSSLTATESARTDLAAMVGQFSGRALSKTGAPAAGEILNDQQEAQLVALVERMRKLLGEVFKAELQAADSGLILPEMEAMGVVVARHIKSLEDRYAASWQARAMAAQ